MESKVQSASKTNWKASWLCTSENGIKNRFFTALGSIAQFGRPIRVWETHKWSVYGNVLLALFANGWSFAGVTLPSTGKLEAGNNEDHDESYWEGSSQCNPGENSDF